ncbi:MAG: hypothetical protein LBT11_05130 [Treponema sp.]|jgi:hypothetical protein|nr:hypothetical protein [Treponema sp.]
MQIYLNGEEADISLEAEQTVGELLSGLDAWLRGSGLRFSGLRIDGESLAGDTLAWAFERPLAGINAIDIRLSSRWDLALEALNRALAALQSSGNGYPAWEESPAASFLAADMPEIFTLVDRAMQGREERAQAVNLAEERIREIEGPEAELARIGGQLKGLADRMEELPLDIQTGKDGRAAETISLFAVLGEKLIRIFARLPEQRDFVKDFGPVVRELQAAYEQKDAVLVGDLAEYEIAPRLRSLGGSLI